MSIFSKLFKKSKHSEDQWAKRPNDSIDRCTSDETQMMSNEFEQEKSSLSAVDIEVINEERTGPRAVEVKIPWGMPRSKMTAEQLNAIREYDRIWYANHRSKEAKEKERGWVVDPTCCAKA